MKYYHKYLGNKSTIQIITLKQDEIKLASILHLLYGKIKYNYLVATNKNYDKSISVGEILVYECINNSIKEKYNKTAKNNPKQITNKTHNFLLTSVT